MALTPQEETIRRNGLDWLDRHVMVETEGGLLPFGLVLTNMIRRTLREELAVLRVKTTAK